MEMQIIMFAFILLLFNGCSLTIPSHVEQALIENKRSSLVTFYYPDPDSSLLKSHSPLISIDENEYFFLKEGEYIRFYLPPGEHKVEVSHAFCTVFDHKELIDIHTTEGQHVYLKTYPVFEGMTFIPYFFIFAVPVPDIRFKLFEVDEERALVELPGKLVNPKERAFIN
jgi:hypothetical protein